jgi:hypothetical protein
MMKASSKGKGIFLSIILLLLSVIFILSIGELAVRILYPFISNYDTEMWRYSVQGKVALTNYCMSHRHKPGAYFKNLYGVEVKINSKGLRDYEYSYEKAANCFRILVLGDSITFGWGVPLELTYSKLLEKELNVYYPQLKVEVINAGVGNYQMRDEVCFLETEGLRYNPDIIIMGFFIDDARVNEKIDYLWFKTHSFLYAFLQSKYNAVLNRYDKKRYFKNYYTNLYAKNSETKKNLEITSEWLKKIVTRENIPLAILLIPDLNQLNPYPFKKINYYLKTLFFDYTKTKVLDLLPYFDIDNIGPKNYWVSWEDPHHNIKAHEIISKAVYPEVVSLINRAVNR